jgi:hypothetical protein
VVSPSCLRSSLPPDVWGAPFVSPFHWHCHSSPLSHNHSIGFKEQRILHGVVLCIVGKHSIDLGFKEQRILHGVVHVRLSGAKLEALVQAHSMGQPHERV